MLDYDTPILNKNGNPIKIANLGAHHCIRCIRTMRALKSKGYEVYGNGKRTTYGIEDYDSYMVWDNERQFKTSIKMFIDAGVSILEWNNEPDEPMVWAKDVIKDMGKEDEVKLIYNAHDLDNVRRGFIPIPERQAFNSADAIIYVSKPIEKICNNLHSVSVPTMVLYNYPTQNMIDETKIDWDNLEKKPPSLVYEGGVNAIGDTDEIKHLNTVFKYRNLFPIFSQLINQGNEVHVLPGNLDAFQTGQHIGATLYPPMNFDDMLKKLTFFKYNLVIFNNEDGKEDQVNFTTPNKLWDGLASGLPALGCWCRETEKYIEKHNIGWTFNSVADIGNCSQLEDLYKEKMVHVRKKRSELIFERQIWRNENLYADILGLEKKGIPNDIKQQSVFEYGQEDTDKLLI